MVHSVAFSPDGKYVLTGSADKTARLWSLPLPWEDSPERIALSVTVWTALEVDERGNVRQLFQPEAFFQRRQQLERLGGSVAP